MQYNRIPVCDILNVPEATEHSTYLGLPNIIGRNKSASLGYLKDKVDTKIRSWDNNYISRPGKEILVKQVAQTMPSYAMNVFLLPLEITRNIEKALSKFWWKSSNSNSSNLCWMSWDRLSKHKNVGGMGLRNFRDFNVAMLGKQLWRLATNPQSLVSRVYKAKYFSISEVLNAELSHNPSFIWRSLLEAKQLLSEGVRWRVGDGTKISMLGQPWLLTDDNPCITSDSDPFQDRTVASLMCTNRKEWDMEVLSDVLNERDRSCVLAIPLATSSSEDKLYWRFEDSGIYSVKSAYRFLQTQKDSWNAEMADKLWHTLWSIRAPPKALNLVWRALTDCLPTLSQLQLKRVQVQATCPTCQQEVESIMHSLVTCHLAR